MGKRIISQARGHGSMVYRVRKKAFIYKLGYASSMKENKGEVIRLINSLAHTAPIIQIKIVVDNKEIYFYSPAWQGAYEGQEIEFNGENVMEGNIMMLKNMPLGTKVFNIEKRPGDGGKMVRSGGGFATVLKKDEDKRKVVLGMNNKKEVILNEKCRASIGVVAGQGRVNKPIVKAGKQFKRMKSRSKKWHTTSAVKVNVVDHPFGGGRGKRIKSKIAKRNAPPGKKVGHIRPKRTGKR